MTRSVVEPDDGSNLRTNKIRNLSSIEYTRQNIKKRKGTRKSKRKKNRNKDKNITNDSDTETPLPQTNPNDIPHGNPIDTSEYTCPFDDPDTDYKKEPKIKEDKTKLIKII